MKKLLALMIFILPMMVFTNPAEVVSGDVTFTEDQNTLHINQSSDRAILSWQDFSIKADETMNFIQPDEKAAILNRVEGKNLSKIYGSLLVIDQGARRKRR